MQDTSELRQPLEVFAIDGKMNRCTGSIPYRSLIWTRRYCEPGEFSMVVPANVYDPSWRYIETDERPETGMIQKVEFNDDAQVFGGIDSVTVSGFFLEATLNRVVFLSEVPETITTTYSVPPPSRPVYTEEMEPTVWTDGEDYYYENSSGQIVNSETGAVRDGTDGLTEQHYTGAYGSKYVDPDNPDAGVYASRYYYYSSDKTQVTMVDDWGNSETHDIAFEDGKGSVFWTEQHNGQTFLYQGLAVVEKEEDTYYAQLKRWNRGHTATETTIVKGPWQRTDTYDPITEQDSVQLVFKWAQNMMGNWLRYVEPEIDGVEKKLDPSFQYHGDLMYSTLYEVGASLRLQYDFAANMFWLEAYRGLDRTQDQSGNPWAVFSDTWGSLTGYSASRDDSNYKNKVFVLYDYEAPTLFSSTGVPETSHQIEHLRDPATGIEILTQVIGYSVWIPYRANRGYSTQSIAQDGEPEIETYLDRRDEKPSCDNLWKRDVITKSYEEPVGPAEAKADMEADAASLVTADDDGSIPNMKAIYEAFDEDMETCGSAYLEQNYPVETVLDTGTVNTSAYLRDFDLGDKVDFAVSTVGLAQTGRIVEVEEVYESGSVRINVTIGDKTLTRIKKGRLA